MPTNAVNKNQYSLTKWPNSTEMRIKLPAIAFIELLIVICFSFIIYIGKRKHTLFIESNLRHIAGALIVEQSSFTE